MSKPLVACIRCDSVIEKPRRNQRFCSSKCKNKRPRLDPHEWDKRTEQDIARAKNVNHLERNLNRFGWTTESFQTAYSTQNGKCAICELAIDLVADHDHVTGEARKLLCMNCNVGLGQFKDSPELLAKAAIYLIESKESERHERRFDRPTR